MTERDPPSELRTARAARGWSQTEAARELAALARSRGMPVAAAASLKTLLSRWENGHSLPEPQYRTLLADLYGRSADRARAGPLRRRREPAGGAQGRAGGRGRRAAWRRSTLASAARAGPCARRRAGRPPAPAAGRRPWSNGSRRPSCTPWPGGPGSSWPSCWPRRPRWPATQALDRTRHDQAWRRFDQVRTAALGGRAAGGRRRSRWPGRPRCWWTSASRRRPCGLLESQPLPDRPRIPGPVGTRRWPWPRPRSGRAGRPAGSAIAAAERRLRRPRVDLVDPRDGPPVELVDLHRWHGRVLVTLGDTDAARTAAAGTGGDPRSTRHRAAVHADLALTLHGDRPRGSRIARPHRSSAGRRHRLRAHSRAAGQPRRNSVIAHHRLARPG